MNPDIVEKEVCIVVGIRSLWNLDPNLPGRIWREKVSPRLHEIGSASGNAKSASIVFAPIPEDENGRYEIVVGRVSDSLERIPIGMAGWEVPAGVYAVVKSESLSNVLAVYRKTIEQWLPATGYEPGHGLVVAQTLFGDPGDAPETVWQVSIQLRNTADTDIFGWWE
ncbi:MAG: GyrI-like domain-containing protein [Planctomycetota bacterium]|jgi:predicted transcriptional regulator YdeE|nr:GyrI-like domain-containing protein [Planctomycetota bacterium]